MTFMQALIKTEQKQVKKLDPDTTTPIYEQQPGESNKQYELFKIYRDLGVKRTQQKACEEAYGKVTIGKQRGMGYMRQLAFQWSWPERISAWEARQDDLLKEELQIEARECARRHLKIGMLLQSKALQRLQNSDASELTIREGLDFAVKGVEIARGVIAPRESGVNVSIQNTVNASFEKRLEATLNEIWAEPVVPNKTKDAGVTPTSE